MVLVKKVIFYPVHKTCKQNDLSCINDLILLLMQEKQFVAYIL